jgi:hypothetical protein
MKTGNKKQAMILSVVAVLAVAFLVYQLMPAKAKPFSAPASPEVSLTQNASTSQNLSLAVLGNPFSHPKLASKPVVTDVKQPPSSIDKSGTFAPVSPGALPGAGGGSPGQDGRSDSGAAGSGGAGGQGSSIPNSPAENAGKDRKEIQGPRIKLTAIMRVGEPVAMLAVNDQPGKTYSEGDLLASNARLIKIGDSSVTVRINGKQHEIATGGSYGAPEENKK